MTTLIVILIIIVAVLLILVVLAQNPKGGGLASGFGGSSATQFMGVKKTGDFLETSTWVFALLLLLFSLTANVMESTADSKGSVNIEKAKESKKATSPQAPDLLPDSSTETPAQ
jgi:preprotein translocase subunit SecG